MKVQKDTGKLAEILIADIVNGLSVQGYEIDLAPVKGINIDKNDIFMSINQGTTINVAYEENMEQDEYYLRVNNKYFKINLTDKGVNIDREASDVEEKNKPIVATIMSGDSVTIGNISESEISLNSGNNTGITQIKISYGRHIKMCEVTVANVPLQGAIANPDEYINTDYGLIEVIWLNGVTNEYSPIPNAPDLYTNLESGKSLTPVTWTYYKDGITVNKKNVNWVEDAVAKSNWYNYTASKGSDGQEDNTSSMWANAKNSDGSYFVWIPRYAYRIKYFSDANYTDLTGFYDGYGMWNVLSGNKKYDLDPGIETVTYQGKEYIVHPAFMDDTAKVDSNGKPLPDYERGGWDKDLTGIWVAKYETSRAGANETNGGSGSNVAFLSVPNVKAATSLTVGTMFTKALAYDNSKGSHMIKNSEWGAAAYLAHSPYGRNGHEVDVNVSGKTGAGSLIPNSEATYEYNTTNGAKASTTGNVYGIYDMSGGTWEHVSGYNKLGNPSRFSTGSSMIAKDASGNYISTKYAATYENSTSDNKSTAQVYLTGKVGDATKELRRSTDSLNWLNDNSAFVVYGAAFFGRGGGGGEGIYAGIFYSDSTRGQSLGAVTFRMALAK